MFTIDIENALAEMQAITQEDIDAHFDNVKSAKAWATIALEQYGLNWQEEYNRKRDANKARDIRQCGFTGHYSLSPTLGEKIWHPTFCKRHECPKCRARMEADNRERLSRLLGFSVIETTKDKEDEVKASLTKDDYLRIPLADEKVKFIVKEGGDRKLNYQEARELAGQMISEEYGRCSGNLGKSGDVLPKAEDEEELIGNDVVTTNVYEINFVSGKLTPEKLEEIVLERTFLDVNRIRDYDYLRELIAGMETLTEQVCQEYDVPILFLYTVSKRVDLKHVQWHRLMKPKHT